MSKADFHGAADSARGESPTPSIPQQTAPQAPQAPAERPVAPEATLSASKMGGAWFHPNNRSTPLPNEKWHSSWFGLKQYVAPKAMTGTPVYKQVGRVSVVPAPKNGNYIPQHLRGPEPALGNIHKTVDYDGTERALTPTQKAENEANQQSRENWLAHHEIETHHGIALEKAKQATPQAYSASNEPSIEELEGAVKSLTPRLKEMHGTLSSIHEAIRPLIQHDGAVASLGRKIATNALNAAEQHRLEMRVHTDTLSSPTASNEQRVSAQAKLDEVTPKYNLAKQTADSLGQFAKQHLTKMSKLGGVPTNLTRGVKALNQGEQVDGALELQNGASAMLGALKHLAKPETQAIFQHAGLELPSNLESHLNSVGQIHETLKEIRTKYGKSGTRPSERGMPKEREKVMQNLRPADLGQSLDGRRSSGFQQNVEGITGTAPQKPSAGARPVGRVSPDTLSNRAEIEKANQQAREEHIAKHMGIAHRAISTGNPVPLDTQEVIGHEGVKAIVNHIAQQQLKKAR